MAEQVSIKPPPGQDASSLEELAREPASFDETPSTATNPDTTTRTPSNYNKNHRGTVGQEQDNSDCDLELKDGEDSELPKVVKVANSLKDCADVGEDERDGAAATKQGHVDDNVGGGDEDGIMGREKPSKRDSSTMSTRSSTPSAISLHPSPSMRDYSRSWSRPVRSGESLCRASWTRTKEQVKGQRG